MAFEFPLTTEQFMVRLPIADITFEPTEAMEYSETGGGEILPADHGVQLWHGRITLGDMTPDEAFDVLPLIAVARQSGASFMVHDVRAPGPRHDRTGAILGASTPVLSAVLANRREIRIGGLPQGYKIQPFDYVAFSYGSNPIRYALHRAANTATAGAGGVAWTTEVTPNIRPGYILNAPVTLLRAACKAIIVPGSYQPGRRKGTLTAGVSFDFIQTLR